MFFFVLVLFKKYLPYQQGARLADEYAAPERGFDGVRTVEPESAVFRLSSPPLASRPSDNGHARRRVGPGPPRHRQFRWRDVGRLPFGPYFDDFCTKLLQPGFGCEKLFVFSALICFFV